MAKAAIERGPVSGALEPGIELSGQLEQLWLAAKEAAKEPSLKKGDTHGKEEPSAQENEKR